MLHFETIEPATFELLRRIQSLDILKDTRLVGGTSLALQLGHRKSVDLDLFGIVPYETFELEMALSQIGNVTTLKTSKSIHIFLVDGVKVDIVNFPFPWRQDALRFDGVVLAMPEDIAAMKVTAIVGRGTKKDFIDIAHLLKCKFSFSQILEFYTEKYPNASYFMACKSLTYFDDAENDAMPDMLSNMTWEEAKQIVLKETTGSIIRDDTVFEYVGK